jgi:hypothetical protein
MLNTYSCETEFLNAVSMKIPVYRDVLPYSLVVRYLPARLHGMTSPKTVIFTSELGEFQNNDE